MWGRESTVLSRDTYSFLDMLGDVGGIWSILVLLSNAIIPFYGKSKLINFIAKTGYQKPKFNPEDEEIKSFCC